MPNVACNTSSFLKSNCKYTRTVESWESKPAKRQMMIWDGAEISADRDFLRELWWSSHMLVEVCVRIRAGALDSQNEPALNLEVWRKNWCWPLKAHVNNRKVIKTLFWQKKKKKSDITTWIHAVRPEQWKEKANWKQSKYVYFQLVWFHLVALVFASVTVLMTSQSGIWRLLNSHEALQGDGVTPCCTLPPVTSVCLGPVTLPEV